MKIKQSIAPHFRLTGTTREIMISQLLGCCALLCSGIILHGFRAVVMTFFGITGASLIEIISRFAVKKQQNLDDFNLSSLVTGILCAILLPVNCSVWLPFFAGLFAVGIAKLPFGELGSSPFNGAAAGYCFASILGANLGSVLNRAKLGTVDRAVFDLLPERCYIYLSGYLPIFTQTSVGQRKVSDIVSPHMLLRAGVDPNLSGGRILLGNYNGAMGVTIGLLVVVCAVWLFFRRSIAWQASAAFCATVAVLSLVFRWNGIPAIISPVYDLLTGSVLCAAVFLCGDIMTAPHLKSARVFYGIGCGVLTIVLRRTGSIEGGEIFAVLLMNALSDPIDRAAWSLRRKGFSVSNELHKLKAAIKKKLNIKGGPFDDVDLDSLEYGKWGDVSRLGKDVKDDEEI